MQIYLDMDGVIVDFFSGLAQYHRVQHWKDIPDKETSILLLQGTDFFYTLEKFETSDELVEWLHELTEGEWIICSSPLRGDHKNSAYWKRQWLDKHGYTPAEQIYTSHKHKHAVNKDGTANILIDDRPENIENWIEAGGIGIRYQANEDSLSELKARVLTHYK